MRGVLSGERDDPAGAFNAEAREVLVGELLRADPALRVHQDGQNARTVQILQISGQRWNGHAVF